MKGARKTTLRIGPRLKDGSFDPQGLIEIPVAYGTAFNSKADVKFCGLIDGVKPNQVYVKPDDIEEEPDGDGGTVERAARIYRKGDLEVGYEVSKDRYVKIDADKAAQIKEETAVEAIEILEFADASVLEGRATKDFHYLQPQPGMAALKALALIREGLVKTKKVALCEFSVGSRVRFGAVTVDGNAMKLVTLPYPEEVQVPDEEVIAPSEIKVSKAELDQAKLLIEALAGDGTVIDQIEDAAVERKRELVEAATKGEVIELKAKPKAAPVTDDTLTDLLSASIAAASKGKKKVAA